MILLTGFEPFGGADFNPSQAIAERAADILRRQGHQVITAELPCVFATAPATLAVLLERWRPRVAIGLGLAGGRKGLGLEKVAINHIDARIADNAGQQPIDVPVREDGANAYFSTLPLKASLQALGEPVDGSTPVDAAISYTAGSFVCNQVFYELMHHLGDVPETRAGFIHVPSMEATDPQMEDLAGAVATVARLALDNVAEPLYSAGTEF